MTFVPNPKILDALGRTDEKRSEYWSAVRDQDFMRYARDPQLLSGIYDMDPERGSKQVSRKRKGPEYDIAHLTEQGFLAGRGAVPFGFLAGLHPDDLKLMADPTWGPAINQLLESQRTERDHIEFQREMEEKAQLRLEQELSQSALSRAFPSAEARFLRFAGRDPNAELTPEAREARLEELRQQVRDEWLNGATAAPAQQESWLEKGFMWTMNGFDWAMQEAMAYANQSPVARVWDMVQADLRGESTASAFRNLYEWRGIGRIFDVPAAEIVQDPEQARVSQQLATERLAQAEAETLRALVGLNNEQAWERLKTEAPQEQAMWLGMTGGLEARAFALFSQARNDQLQVEEQLQNWMEEQDWDDQAQLRLMDETDYGFTDWLVSGLAWYGKHVPMMISTIASQGIEDMYRSDVTTDWSDIPGMLEANEYSPAKVFGLENTVAGLALDFGAGVLFDPLNLVFAPSGLGAGRPYTAAAARRLARQGVLSRTTDDIVRLAGDSTSSMSSVARVLAPYDAVGLGDDVLDALNLVDPVYGGAAWRTVDDRARVAREVPTSMLHDLMDEGTVAELAKISDTTIDNLATNLQRHGPNKVATVVYSVRTGTFHVTDGLPELLAAERIGAKSFPTSVVVREYFPGKGVSASSVLSPDEIARLESGHRLSDAYLYHGSNRGDLTTIERGGLTPDLSRAQGYAQARVDRSGVGQPYVYVIREADVPEGPVQGMLQQAAETGYADIPSMSFAPEGAPGLRPTAVVGPGQEWSPFMAEGDLIGGQRHVRPDRALPSRLINPGVDIDRLNTLREQAMLRGMQSPGASRTVIAQAATEHFRELLRSGEYGKLGKWMFRYASRNFTSNRFATGGVSSMADIMEIPYRIWGSDVEMADHFAGRIIAWRKARATEDAIYIQQLADLAPLRMEVDALRTLKGEAWDDITRHMDRVPEHPGHALIDRADDMEAQLRDLELTDPAAYEARKLQQLDEAATAPTSDELYEMAPEDRPILGGAEQEVRDMADWQRGQQEQFMRAEAEFEQSLLNRQQMQEEFLLKNKELRRRIASIDAARAAASPGPGLQEILVNAAEEFNRKYIATNPIFRPYVGADGLVPWDIIRLGLPPEGGMPVFPGSQGTVFTSKISKQYSSEFGNIDRAMQPLIDTPSIVELPVSPMELVAARELGAAAYRRFTHMKLTHSVRLGALQLHTAWIIDKVMNIAVAAAAGLDEGVFMSMKHGARVPARRLADLATTLPARLGALRHGRISPEHGMRHAPGYAQRRWAELQSLPAKARQLEQTLYDAHGFGLDDIVPGDREYPRAARVYTQRLSQSPAFQALMEGPDAFREWFWGPEGRVARESTNYDFATGTSKIAEGPEQVFEQWTNLFETVVLGEARKAGKAAEVRAALEAMVKAHRTGQGVPHFPNALVPFLGPIRGARKLPGRRGPVTKVMDVSLEYLYDRPADYRRAFIAQVVRQEETKRLTSLFTDQGKRIISDTEVAQVLGMHGVDWVTMEGLRPALHKRAWENDYVMRSMLDELVDLKVSEVIQAETFTYDMGRRAGQQAKALFPFPRPWADFVGRWSRDIFARPALRGWINESNFLGMRSILEKLPINPKPLSFISRMANTDFEVEGLYPGSPVEDDIESIDFSPLLFLPTANETNLNFLIPGIGMLPALFADLALPDPLADPVKYQEIVNTLGEFFPSLHFMGGDLATDMIGGGTFARTASLGFDLYGALTGRPYYEVTHYLGDISRDIARSREVRAILADPEVMQELIGIEDEAELDLRLRELALQADRKASILHITESATRLLSPVRARYDDSVAQIHDVWIEAAENFSDLTPYRPLRDGATAEERAQYANDVRSSFFELPQWRRDMYIAKQPSLAVNLIGSWEWTREAIDTLVPGTGEAYAIRGTPDGLARHDQLVDAGMVRPLSPIEMGRRILGLQYASRISVAKHMYRFQAETVNNYIWENFVPVEAKASLDGAALSGFAQRVGIATGREMWEQWNSLRDEMLASGEFQGVINDDGTLSIPGVPEAWERWNSDFPGIAGNTDRFNNLQLLEFPTEVQEIAEVLDIRLDPGMSGLTFYDTLQQIVDDVQTPLVYQVTRPAYDDYVGERSVVRTTRWQQLHEAAYAYRFSPEWRQALQEFMLYVGNVEDDSLGEDRTRRDIPLAVQQQVADRYWNLAATARDSNIPWNAIWEGRFRSRFGPKDWEPPVPPALRDEAGELTSEAWQPFIVEVVDGDSLIVSEADRPALFGTDARPFGVRLLGVNAPELPGEEGLAATERLEDALMSALRSQQPIYLVRDPDTFGTRTDQYGRELAWLFIGEEPFYFEEDFRRHRDPSRIGE